MSRVVAREANTKMLSQAHFVSIMMQKVRETESSSEQLKELHPATPTPAKPIPVTPLIGTPKSTVSSEPFVHSPLMCWQKNTSKNKTTVVNSTSHLLSAHKTPQSKAVHSDDGNVQTGDKTVGSSVFVTSLMNRMNKLKQLKCVELPDSLKTPTMKKSPVINTNLQLPSSLRPQSILKQHHDTSALATNLATSHRGVSDTVDSQSSTRRIRYVCASYCNSISLFVIIQICIYDVS